MNYNPSTPWYRRFQFGDQFPNKEFWYVFQASIRGATVLVERHTHLCRCSYCRGEHGHGMLWLPKDRSRNSWRVVNLFHRVYIRWTLPRPRS
jgi:hypothetical protein